MRLGDSIENNNTTHTLKPTGSTIMACCRCDAYASSYQIFNVYRNPYNHMHGSIDFQKYLKNNPTATCKQLRREKGYASFDYHSLTLNSIINLHSRIRIDPNHLTKNVVEYLIQCVNCDYLNVNIFLYVDICHLFLQPYQCSTY